MAGSPVIKRRLSKAAQPAGSVLVVFQRVRAEGFKPGRLPAVYREGPHRPTAQLTQGPVPLSGFDCMCVQRAHPPPSLLLLSYATRDNVQFIILTHLNFFFACLSFIYILYLLSTVLLF